MPECILCPKKFPWKGEGASKKSARAEDTPRYLPPKRSKTLLEFLGDSPDRWPLQMRCQGADPIRVPPFAGEHLIDTEVKRMRYGEDSPNG